jgi:hypothetical protein
MLLEAVGLNGTVSESYSRTSKTALKKLIASLIEKAKEYLSIISFHFKSLAKKINDEIELIKSTELIRTKDAFLELKTTKADQLDGAIDERSTFDKLKALTDYTHIALDSNVLPTELDKILDVLEGADKNTSKNALSEKIEEFNDKVNPIYTKLPLCGGMHSYVFNGLKPVLNYPSGLKVIKTGTKELSVKDKNELLSSLYEARSILEFISNKGTAKAFSKVVVRGKIIEAKSDIITFIGFLAYMSGKGKNDYVYEAAPMSPEAIYSGIYKCSYKFYTEIQKNALAVLRERLAEVTAMRKSLFTES